MVSQSRYISISRWESLFFGSHAETERGCIFYSLACSYRPHKINFYEYMSDILNRLTSCRGLPHRKHIKKFFLTAGRRMSRANTPGLSGDAYPLIHYCFCLCTKLKYIFSAITKSSGQSISKECKSSITYSRIFFPKRFFCSTYTSRLARNIV